MYSGSSSFRVTGRIFTSMLSSSLKKIALNHVPYMDNQVLSNTLCLHGVQQRFTRAKTIGANYTEEKTKNRIRNKDKEIGNIIDIKKSEKARSSKGYEQWATRHNLKTAVSTLVEIRNKGFNSMKELEQSSLGIANNNINQIARRLNKTGVIYKTDIKEIKRDIAKIAKEQWDIHSLLLKRTKELNK